MITHNYKISDLKHSGVYMLICKHSGKFYIGSTVNLYDRCKEHKSYFNNNKHNNRYMQNIANKYKEGFEFTILEYCDKSLLRVRELGWMKSLKPVLNLTATTDNLISHTLETRAKLSKARKGVPISEAHRAKIILNIKHYSESRKGVPIDEDHKAKIRKNMPQSKWIKINGIVYDSIKYASKNLPISRQSLSDLVNGKTKELKHKAIREIETQDFKIINKAFPS